MEETSTSNVSDWRADLLPSVDHIHPESVHRISTNVVTVHARYEYLSLMVVYEQPSQHLGGSEKKKKAYKE